MHVFEIAAISLDGYIGHNKTDRSTNWTSKEDSRWFHRRSKEAGVMVLGNSTFKTFGEQPLPERHHVVYTSDETKLAMPKTPELRYTNLPPQALIQQLAAEGYDEVAICGGTTIYTMFLAAGVVDHLYLTIEPVLFGQGVKLVDGDLDLKLALEGTEHLSEQTVVMSYKVFNQEK